MRRLHSERLNLIGHRGQVYGVTFAPDGRVLATGGEDGLIKLWDLVGGQELATLAGHRGCVNGLAYSPDGQILASVSCDHTIKLWHPRTHQLLTTLDRHPDEVRCLAFSPDGTRLATGGKGKLVVVWDVAAREPFEMLNSQGETVDSIEWRDDHTLILPAGELVLWNVDTGERRLINHGGGSFAISRDRRDAVQAMNDGIVRSIPELSNTVAELKGRGSPAKALCFLPNRNWLAVGDEDGCIQLCGWPDTNFRQVLPGHTSRVQSLAVAPDGDQLASASWDGTVKVWAFDVESNSKSEFPCFFRKGTVRQNSLATTPELTHVAVRSRPDQVGILELANGHQVTTLDVPDDLWALNFSATDPSVLYGYAADSGSIWKWNWRTGEAAKLGAKLRPGLADPALGGNGQLITFASDGPRAISAEIYDASCAETWWQLKSTLLPVGNDRNVVFSPDGQTCAVGSANRKGDHDAYHAAVLDLLGKRKICETIQRIGAIANAGREIVVDPWGERRFSVIETVTGREIASISKSSQISSECLSPDGRTLCGGDTNGRVYLWDVVTSQLVAQLETGGERIEILHFSADGRALLAITFSEKKGNESHDAANARAFVWYGVDGP